VVQKVGPVKTICPKCKAQYSKVDKYCVYDGTLLPRTLNWPLVGLCVVVAIGVPVFFAVCLTARDPELAAYSLTKVAGSIGLALVAAYYAFRPRRKKS
jgi:hypothetical protein